MVCSYLISRYNNICIANYFTAKQGFFMNRNIQNSGKRKIVTLILPFVSGLYLEVYRRIQMLLEKEIPDIYIRVLGGGEPDSLHQYSLIDSITDGEND